MTRISLREAYDNKDVIAQIFRLRDEVNAIAAILEDIAPNGDVTNIVTKTDEQTITGKKIFTADPTIESDNYPNLNMVDNDSHAVDGQAAEYGAVVGRNADDDRMCELRMGKVVVGGVDENFAIMRAYRPSNTSQNSAIFVRQSDSGDGWATAPVRTYNSANTDDIVTIGSLASNPSVVHTTGNESIAGNKEWSGTQTLLYQGPNVKTTLDVTSMNAFAQRSLMVGYDTNDKAISGYAVSTATTENTSKLTLSRYDTLGNVVTTSRLILVATDSGAQLRLEKTTGGVTTSTTVATI